MGYRKHDKCVFNVAKDVSTKDAKELHDLYICIGCEVDTNKSGEIYFVNGSIWNGVAETSEGSLCVGCLEARLGRKLTRVDFTGSHPLNWSYTFKSRWLWRRLGTDKFPEETAYAKQKAMLEKPSRAP
jgi:hypothetical protein